MRLTLKQFLSDSPSETGFIVVTAETAQLENVDEEGSWSLKNPNVNAEVQIGDCSKKIYLDFCVYKDSDVQKRIDKINVLIDNLQQLKDALPTMWCDSVRVCTEYKELNKDKNDEEHNPS